MPLLEVRDLSVEFRTRRGPVRALDRVSFSIEPGEVLGVVGESGAGKSLTGAAIIGLLEPPGRISGGQIVLDGKRIDDLPYARMRPIRGKQIGAIFQDPMTSLNPLYTIGRQLAETITTHLGVGASEARRRAISWLERVGIPAAARRIDAYPHEFSGGMRQRVVIALALCAEPRLIVADEPTTALDVSIQAQIIELLKSLARERGTSAVRSTPRTSSRARSRLAVGAWSTSARETSPASIRPERSQTAARTCAWPTSTPTAKPARGTIDRSTGGRPVLRGRAASSGSSSSTIPARSSSSSSVETVGRERPVASTRAIRVLAGRRCSARRTRTRLTSRTPRWPVSSSIMGAAPRPSWRLGPEGPTPR